MRALFLIFYRPNLLLGFCNSIYRAEEGTNVTGTTGSGGFDDGRRISSHLIPDWL
jgi:hypothetical protein